MIAKRNEQCDVLILGAGAAGLMCALTAAQRHRKVILIDHNHEPGRKIAISGGGKANFTNLHMSPEFFFGHDVTFTEPALDGFAPDVLLQYMAKHGLSWEEREHGQLFGLAPAREFVHTLWEQCQRHGCEFLLGHAFSHVRFEQGKYMVQCHTVQENTLACTIEASSLVLALGSPAWSQVGASSAGVHMAKQWGHKATSFTPVLTPLHMEPTWPLSGLSGISLPVTVRVQRADTGQYYSHSEALLFTHTGISGPAILQASCHWQEGQPLHINFLPHMHLEELLDAPECGKLFVRTLLARQMPQRLVDALLPAEWSRRKIAELSRKVRKTLHECVHNHTVIPQKRGGLHKAEAARGGILVQDVNAWSMESLLQERLFIVGELLDVTGHLGGYNLHWAFASGHLAGQHV